MGIIPHYIDYKYISDTFKDIPGILVIDINRQVEPVCDDIVSCDAIISSSLHGIITSHAYNVPTAWMSVSSHTTTALGGGHFKYLDYYLSRDIKNNEIGRAHV